METLAYEVKQMHRTKQSSKRYNKQHMHIMHLVLHILYYVTAYISMDLHHLVHSVTFEISILISDSSKLHTEQYSWLVYGCSHIL